MVKPGSSGFTLLEVLIAISIMVIGVGTVLMIESNSMQATDKARRVTVAAMLAKRTMVQAEMDFEGKTFNDLKESESGNFESPFESYQWTRTIKEVEFPNLSPGKEASKLAGGDDPNANSNNDMMTSMVTGFLSKGLREVTVSIRWPRGKGFQEMSVTQYWVNLNNELQLTP